MEGLSYFYVINKIVTDSPTQMGNLWLYPLFWPRWWGRPERGFMDQAPNQPAHSGHRVGARNKSALWDVIITIVIVVSMLIYWQIVRAQWILVNEEQKWLILHVRTKNRPTNTPAIKITYCFGQKYLPIIRDIIMKKMHIAFYELGICMGSRIASSPGCTKDDNSDGNYLSQTSFQMSV